MRQTVFALTAGTGLGLSLILLPVPAAAGGVIENACLKADRRDASRALCGCIQAVADSMLSGSEQRRGARFFAEPHLSQETRMSDRRSDEQFWEKWKSFGVTAEEYCR